MYTHTHTHTHPHTHRMQLFASGMCSSARQQWSSLATPTVWRVWSGEVRGYCTQPHKTGPSRSGEQKMWVAMAFLTTTNSDCFLKLTESFLLMSGYLMALVHAVFLTSLLPFICAPHIHTVSHLTRVCYVGLCKAMATGWTQWPSVQTMLLEQRPLTPETGAWSTQGSWEWHVRLLN